MILLQYSLYKNLNVLKTNYHVNKIKKLITDIGYSPIQEVQYEIPVTTVCSPNH